MNLDEAKENIQPLASGRNIQRLETALNAESHESCQAELLHERRGYEEAIHTYDGPDPLAPWYEYVLWVEQSYPKSGKQSALDEVIQKCLLKFEKDARYNQDPRLVKLYIKYLDSQPNPTEHFQALYNSGIGTMVADLYIFWAYLYDVTDNFERAEAVFQKGHDAKAEPRDALELAHKQFGFSMSQRLLHKDKYRDGFLTSMEERRNALTSLRTQRGQHSRKEVVGSVRTGAAVKSHAPGRVDQNQRPAGTIGTNQASNERFSVFVDGASANHPAPQAVVPKSIVQLIMDSSRKQENLREPGPWSKAGAKQSSTMFANAKSSVPSFPILEDMDLDSNEVHNLIPMSRSEDNFSKPIRLPSSFISRNEPLTPFPTAFFIEEPVVSNCFPAYDKCMVFPKLDKSFSIEELAAYRWFTKRGLANAFTDEQDAVWSNDISTGIRLYPQFAESNELGGEWHPERYIADELIEQGKARFAFDISTIYPKDSAEEFTLEDYLYRQFQNGTMAWQQLLPEPDQNLEQSLMGCSSMDLMDETIPVQGRQSIFRGAIRKSVVPGGRKSIFPGPEDRGRMPMAKSAMSMQSQTHSNTFENTFKQSPVIERTIHPIAEEESAHEPEPTLVAPTPLIRQPPVQPTPSPFVIFEDPDTLKEKASFKVPIMPIEQPLTTLSRQVIPVQPAISPFAIFEDPNPPKENASFKAPIVPIEQPPTTLSRQVPPVQVTTSPFAIFEDPNPRNEKASFKAPILPIEQPPKTLSRPVPPVQPTTSPFAIFEDPDPPKEKASLKALNVVMEQPPTTTLSNRVMFREPEVLAQTPEPDGASGGPISNPNETCFSTQQFMFFIKAQSVSTPKANRQRKDHVEQTSPTAYAKQTNAIANVQELVSPPAATAEPDVAHASCNEAQADVSPPQPARQLSTIMETTESTTQMSSSSERESDSTSKTLSRPAGFFPHKTIQTVTNLSVVAEHPSTSSDIPTTTECPIPIYMDATAEMPVIRPSTQRVTFSNKPTVLTDILRPKPTAAVPVTLDTTIGEPLMERSIAIKGTNATLPIFEMGDDRTQTIPVHQSLMAQSIHEVSRAAPAMPLPDMSIASLSLMSIREGNTGQLPVVKQASDAAAVEKRVSFLPEPSGDKVRSINMSKHADNDNMHANMRKPFAISEPRTLQNMPSMNASIASVSSANLLPEKKSIERIGATGPSTATKTLGDKFDDDFLDMFTKTPDKASTYPTMGAGSSNKKLSSRIPVPSSSSKSSAVKSFSSFAPFELASIHIKTELPDESIAPAPLVNHVSFDMSSFEASLPNETHSKQQDDVALGLASASMNNRNGAPPANNRSTHFKASEFTSDAYESWSELSVLPPEVELTKMNYIEPAVDMNETRQVIDSHLVNAYSNPFDDDIKAAFLDQCYFVDYMKSLDTCVMMNTLRPVYPRSRLDIADRTFDVLALIGQGNFGHVFSAKCKTTEQIFALKQQRPANLWEFYICLEIASRMNDFPNMINAFMPVQYALIGNNASILVSPFMKYGSLINVCNKVRQTTNKNIAEPVVMLLAMQLLSIVDHLHACKIIHADIKPDNILLVQRLSNDHHEICLQLIDFGQAIDMQLYPDDQTFRSKLNTKNFVCTEMLSDKPWSYQTDLFCLAATFHTLLFGADMIVCKSVLGYKLKTNIPRYFCRDIWDSIFQTLINIKDCRTMPNLQSLRQILLQEVSDKINVTLQAVTRFNSIIDQKQ